MYIWIGCKLPANFETELRDRCLTANRSIGLDTVAFSLPQHISLKISFDTPDHEAVLKHLTEYLSSRQTFTVRLGKPEQAGTILWLPAEENPVLRQLHEELDTTLTNFFDIPQHEFDKSFLFHSTLFLDKNTDKLAVMKAKLDTFPLPRELTVDTFLLGLSPDGSAGSYRVISQIRV